MYTCVTVCMYVYVFVYCCVHFMPSSLSVCQIVGGILCVYWQITVGSAATCLLDTLSNRQKIGLNICLLLCSAAAWMQTQQLWLLLTVTTRTGCLRRLSEDLLLHLHRKVRRMSQIKQENSFSLWTSLQTLWNLEVIVCKLCYHHTSNAVVGGCP